MKKQEISRFLNTGTAIGLCTGVSIVVGAFLQNVAMCLILGAGIDVVIAAICAPNKQQDR